MSSNKKEKYDLDTWFDRLPIEIILDLLDYLSSNDILYSFFDFNQRFNNLLMQRQCLLRSLELLTSNLDAWKQILASMGSKIETLVITNDHLLLPLNLFTQLKSLIVSSLDCFHFNQLKLILESDQFKNLHSLKINTRLLQESENILEKVFSNENTLETFEIIQPSSRTSMDFDKLKLNLNLCSLILQLRGLYVALHIIQYTPNLEYLNLTTATPDIGFRSNAYPDVSPIQLKKIYLTFDSMFIDHFFDGLDLDLIINFIKQFSSSLKCLSLDLLEMDSRGANDFPFDGIKLQKQLLESMTHLEKFHLYARWPHHNINIDTISVLSTFQNQFWFDHNWFLGSHGDYLYTLPFSFKHFHNFTDFGEIRSSNDEFLINNSRIWYNVTSVGLTKSCKVDSNFLQLFKIKMPKLTSITVNKDYFRYSETTKHPNINENERDELDVTLDNITTVHFRNGSMKDEDQWLIHALPNLKHLTLDNTQLPLPTSQLALMIDRKIQRLGLALMTWEMSESIEIKYFPNVKYLNITIWLSDSYCGLDECPIDVMKVLQNTKKLQILSICFYDMYREEGAKPVVASRRVFEKFDLNEIMKSFLATHYHDYITFSRKT